MCDVVPRCSITSSADPLNVSGRRAVNVSLHGGPSLNVGGPAGPAMNVGSLPDLLSVNIQPPLMTPLDDVSNDSAMTAASLPTYDMAVATSNRRTQQLAAAAVTSQQQLTAEVTSAQQSQPQPRVLTTGSSAKTGLLAGGNTIVLVPQVPLLRTVKACHQGCVATQLSYGGICGDCYVAYLPMKAFLKSVHIRRRYGQKFDGAFFMLLSV